MKQEMGKVSIFFKTRWTNPARPEPSQPLHIRAVSSCHHKVVLLKQIIRPRGPFPMHRAILFSLDTAVILGEKH